MCTCIHFQILFPCRPSQSIEQFPGHTAGLCQLSVLYIGLPWIRQQRICRDVGYRGSIPGSGGFPGERNGYPLQYSCLENSMDRGACIPMTFMCLNVRVKEFFLQIQKNNSEEYMFSLYICVCVCVCVCIKSIQTKLPEVVGFSFNILSLLSLRLLLGRSRCGLGAAFLRIGWHLSPLFKRSRGRLVSSHQLRSHGLDLIVVNFPC